MSPEHVITSAAKVFAALIAWVAIAVIIFRFGVAGLWGSGSDLGLIGAPCLAAFGVLALAYLAAWMIRLLRKDFTPEKEKSE